MKDLQKLENYFELLILYWNKSVSVQMDWKL